MKTKLPIYCSALFIIALSLGLGQGNQAFGQCPSFNGSLTSYIVNYPGYPNSPAMFETLVTDSEPLPIGTYLTWCIDANVDINAQQFQYSSPGTQYSGTLIPTCDTNLNSKLPSGHTPTVYNVPPQTWKMVNYLLNHKNGAYFWDIQVAIWNLVGGPAPTGNYPPSTPAYVTALLADATNNAASWVPQCGDIMGVIYVVTTIPDSNNNPTTGQAQILLIEVPSLCLTAPSSCGTVGTPYSSAVVAAGGTQPYTYSIVSGSLPIGLQLDADGTKTGTAGTIYGSPTTAGTSIFTVKVVDSTTHFATVTCSITIINPVTISCPATTTGVVGVPYTSSFTASGGSATPKYNYSICIGSLPDGLQLNANTGAITGTPTAKAIGTSSFTVCVKDSNSGGCGSANQPCSITVNYPPVLVNCVTINAVQGVAITPVTLTASGGCGGPYTFSSTNLPNGLTMSPGGTFSGTSTVTGPFNFTVTTTDNCGNKGKSACSGGNVKPPCQASVCGFVFADCNGDGFLTPGFDIGMSNILVTLKNSNNVIVAINKTGSDGSYCFNNLTPGNYSACIGQPTNCIQTAGTHVSHWLNNTYQQCWNENDGYQHCKGADGVDRWTANDNCQHWKNSNNQDCWKDKYGISRTQSCTYVSCDVPKGNCETFTLTNCQALTGVNFAYLGNVCKAAVTVTGPTAGVCGNTGNYTCYVVNTGTACYSDCKVTVCGKTYNCPALSPGQSCSFTFNYQYQFSDWGNFNCKATASCTYPSSNTPYTATGSCSTSVSFWSWSW